MGCTVRCPQCIAVGEIALYRPLRTADATAVTGQQTSLPRNHVVRVGEDAIASAARLLRAQATVLTKRPCDHALLKRIWASAIGAVRIGHLVVVAGIDSHLVRRTPRIIIYSYVCSGTLDPGARTCCILNVRRRN